MTDWHDIGAAEEFADDAPIALQAGGTALAVFRLGEELFALHDLCTHGNARLSDGYVEDGCVECPLHQGLFDIRTGAPRCAPVTEAVRSFPVRVVAGRVEVALAGNLPQAEPEAPVQTVTAQVTSIERPASDVAVLRLEMAEGAAMEYRAGQYVDVTLPDGIRRSYSMATPPGARQLELHIRHMPGGAFTDRVFSQVDTGDRLLLEGPGGRFFLRETHAAAILLASGTGFAPLKAIVEEAIRRGATRRMTLYWGGRRPRDLYMDALCRRWDEELPWFRYVPVVSDAQPDDLWTGRSGFVHQAVMQDYADLSAHEVYACGAPAMIEVARKDFVERCALGGEAFFADAFVSLADASRTVSPADTQAAPKRCSHGA